MFPVSAYTGDVPVFYKIAFAWNVWAPLEQPMDPSANSPPFLQSPLPAVAMYSLCHPACLLLSQWALISCLSRWGCRDRLYTDPVQWDTNTGKKGHVQTCFPKACFSSVKQTSSSCRTSRCLKKLELFWLSSQWLCHMALINMHRKRYVKLNIFWCKN